MAKSRWQRVVYSVEGKGYGLVEHTARVGSCRLMVGPRSLWNPSTQREAGAGAVIFSTYCRGKIVARGGVKTIGAGKRAALKAARLKATHRRRPR